MSFAFDDILSRAEKLTSIGYQSKISCVSASQETSIDGVSVLDQNNRYLRTGLDNDLNNIFRCSEHLWKKSTSSSPIQKNFLFGDKGVVFGVSAPTLQDSTAVEALKDDDLQMEVDIERVRLEAERAFFNHVLISKPQPIISPANKAPRQQITSARYSTVNPAITSRRELIFGDKIRKYLRSGRKRDLSQLLGDAAKEGGTDGVLAGVWTETTAIVNQKIMADRDDQTTIALLVEKACDYLHKLFVDHMNVQVERNLERAERGGVPGTRGLVGAYLKVGVDDPNAEDGTIPHDGLPVWEVTYHCFRAGDLSAAKDALGILSNFPQSAVLVACLNHLAKESKLDIDLKKKLKVEWRHNANSARDKYKRALYAALLGLDSPLVDTMENWLWFKLIALRIDPHTTAILYGEVQKNISIDYGESYFMSAGTSEFHYYFTALWLSGQFERAIQLLFDCGHIADAVHVAILAHELGYLRNTTEASAGMVVVESPNLTKCSLNVARLLVAYTKEFELTDVGRALDYWFLLKGVTSPSGSDVFEMAVSRGVYLTGQSSEILGTIGPDGRRKPGMIDEYVDDPSEIICRVAQDTELGGDCSQAVRLYILANVPTKAVDLLCTELSDALRGSRSSITDLRTLAEEFVAAQRGCRSSDLSTLCILLDICTLFALCDAGQAEKALHVSQQLRLVPVDPDSAAIIVGEFHLVPQKVREVIPDLCLRLMRCMADAIHSVDRPNIKFIKQVKAIILYIATVNYKCPQHINSKLLQLQASISV